MSQCIINTLNIIFINCEASAIAGWGFSHFRNSKPEKGQLRMPSIHAALS